MQVLCTASEMKQIDTCSIRDFGIPSVVLMERAALAVAERAGELGKGKRIFVLAGVGNNGADGLAAARMLCESNQVVCVFLGNQENATEEWKLQLSILRKMKASVWTADVAERVGTYPEPDDLVIDALFGIGLKRTVTGKYSEWIDRVNASGACVLSVDIASGISSDTGMVMGNAIHATETVTFGCRKAGQLLYPGRDYCGKLTQAAIGFPASSILNAKCRQFVLGKEDFHLPKRAADGNKGTFGHVLIIAGKKNMAGAAVFAAKAAYACGSGLVRVITEECNRTILQTLVPEAILTTWNQTPEELNLDELFRWASAVVIGPGIGMDEAAQYLVKNTLFSCLRPTVYDADALNLIAKNPEWKKNPDQIRIFTPHKGELSRLMNESIDELNQDACAAARQAAQKFESVMVCKDAATVTALRDESVFVNETGNQGMAIGGSGDVLAGVMGALLGLHMSADQAAPLGVALHGAAGDLAREKIGDSGMGPQDIINGMKSVLMEAER